MKWKIAFACFVLFSWSGWLQAEDNDELIVLASEYPPFLYVAGDGKVSGYSAELFEILQTRLGWNYEIRVQPWARVLKQLHSRKNVLVFNYARTPAREPNVLWSEPYSHDTIHFFALSSRKDVKVSTPDELRNHSVVTYRGSAVIPLLEDLGFTSDRWAKADSPNQLVGMLQKERVDLVVDFEKGFLANSLYFNVVPVVTQPLSKLVDKRIAIGFAMSKGSDPAYLEAINGVINTLEESGERANLEQRWFDYLRDAYYVRN
jgi:ABC-type amino acid transport substrate-binding protein